MRTYALVLVRGEESEGLRLWSFGKGIYQDLLKTMMDPDYGDITDIENGFDIKITVTKTPGKKWADTSIMPRPKQSPLGTKKEIEKIMSNVPDLNDLFELQSYEQIENSVTKWLSGGAQDPYAKSDDSVGVSNSDPKNSTTESKGSNRKTDVDLDDAFGDLEEEFPF